MEYLRIWTEADTETIQQSILIVDDKFGFCPGCKEMGIKLDNLKSCPKCTREFQYVTSREARGGEKALAFVARIIKKLPALTFVDYDDYEYITRKKRAEGLFSGI
ncbi:MAG: hypothetical protein JXN64_01920 [Spirochaetes bacterium]|nr:hypothetical protein [Spirochaetota bacterium]